MERTLLYSVEQPLAVGGHCCGELIFFSDVGHSSLSALQWTILYSPYTMDYTDTIPVSVLPEIIKLTALQF